MSRLLVIGTGLIGGSFALAARAERMFEHIDGYDTNAAIAGRAVRVGAIDRGVTDLAAAVAQADAVLVSVPTPAIAATVLHIAPHVGAHTTVFDSGSVKGSVLAALRAHGTMPTWFVPSHPMAGSERAGPEAADARLFRDRPVIVVPQPENDDASIARVRDWWRATGAQVVDASAEIHDSMVALTSHLPHLVAYAFMNWFDSAHASDPRSFAGPGLHDFTRIAESDPIMWREILSANRTAVLSELDGLVGAIEQLAGALRSERADELQQLLTKARGARLRLKESSNA